MYKIIRRNITKAYPPDPEFLDNECVRIGSGFADGYNESTGKRRGGLMFEWTINGTENRIVMYKWDDEEIEHWYLSEPIKNATEKEKA